MRAKMYCGAVFIAVVGCGENPDIVEAVFADELVEAAGRTAVLSVLASASCAELQTQTFDAVERLPDVIRTVRTSYPIRPESNALEDVPRGEPLVIDLTILNAGGRLVGRGCATTALPRNEPATIQIDMFSLPSCGEEPTTVDLTMVIDTSIEMQQADILFGNTVIDELLDFVDLGGFPPGTRFSVVTHGHSEPTERIAPNQDREVVKAAIESLRGLNDGDNRHFEAIILATELMRTRAVCGRRPAAVVVSAGVDRSAPGNFENAVIGLVATRGDLTDDIYSVGIALSDGARQDLGDLIPLEVGEVFGAGTSGGFATALSTARFRVQAIVDPS